MHSGDCRNTTIFCLVCISEYNTWGKAETVWLGGAGTDMTGAHGPLQTPFDRKKAAAIGLRKWVRFAKDGETTIMQASTPSALATVFSVLT